MVTMSFTDNYINLIVNDIDNEKGKQWEQKQG